MIKVYFDNNLIDEDSYTSLSNSYNLFDKEFYLGSIASNTFNLGIDKQKVESVPQYLEIKNDTKTLAKLSLDSISEDKYTYNYLFTDKMVDLEFNYDASPLMASGSTTLLEIVQDICSKVGIELGTTDFRGYDKLITWYDNEKTARQYIGYVAELNGGYAQIGTDGKLYFKKHKQESKKTIDIDECSDFVLGEHHKITKVYYELGDLVYTFGDETGDTLYLNSENVYITTEEDVQGIYNDIKDFEYWCLEVPQCPVDEDIKAGDVITFTDGESSFNTIANNEMSYYGGWTGGYKLDINTKRQEETKPKGIDKIVKKLSIEVDRDKNLISQTIEETSKTSEQVTNLTQTVNDISISVKSVQDGIQTANANVQTLEGTVTDMSFNFSTKGLNIGTSQDQNNSLFDNRGVRVYNLDKLVAIFNNKGSGIEKLIVTGTAQIGYLKFVKGEKDYKQVTKIYHLKNLIEDLKDLEV